jgi:uncharacterized protein
LWLCIGRVSELMLRELAKTVAAVYADCDAAVAHFQAASGLSCPQGCGSCCLFARVEATALEFIPLAFQLFGRNQAEQFLDRLAVAPEEPRCLLFRPDSIERGGWGCSHYANRPLVCRLFGFAGNRDRNGVARLALCRTMKELEKPVGDSAKLIDISAPMPLFAEAGMRLTALHPGYGTLRLPINKALAQALMIVGMFLELSEEQGWMQPVMNDTSGR